MFPSFLKLFKTVGKPVALLLCVMLVATLVIGPSPATNAESLAAVQPAQSSAPMISFVTDELPDRKRDLWVMRTDGTDKKQLTSGFNVWFASWRPDGKRIAVTTESAKIYTLNPDGTDLKEIASGAFSPPFWSPDGHFIAFVDGQKFGAPIARGNLYIVSANGGTPWKVPGGNDIPSLPPGAAAVAWSGDGTRIAAGWPARIFHIAGGPGSEVGIEAIKGEGAGMFVVAGGWGPNNKMAMTDGNRYGILDMPTGEFVTIATSPPQRQNGIARPGVSWAPNIGKLAFAINSDREDGQRLFLADLDGRNARIILSHPQQAVYRGEVSDYGPPFFSADARTMLLRVSRTTSRGGALIFTHESWLVRTDGSGGEKLVDGFNANWRPGARLDLPYPGFWFQWRTTDLPVANGQAARGWIWGPTVIYSGTEHLGECPPGGPCGDVWFTAVYFDKGRMEIADPYPSRPTKYLVTGGILARELVTGQIMRGPSTFERRNPPEIIVAGDDPNADAPTYATFNKLGAGTDTGRAQDRTGQPVEQTLARDGTIRTNADLGRTVKVAAYVRETGHNLPDVFANYFRGQSWDWIALAGYPISEPYWAYVGIAGQKRYVLVQVMERRTITYDPAAPDGYKVQFGNVGRHYYEWRYGNR